jgi:hypothetical protein
VIKFVFKIFPLELQRILRYSIRKQLKITEIICRDKITNKKGRVENKEGQKKLEKV